MATFQTTFRHLMRRLSRSGNPVFLVRQLWILAEVCHAESISTVALCSKARISRSSAITLLNALARKNLVQLEYATSPNSKQSAITASPTALGIETVQALEASE